jgi:hypothetical protein
VISRFESPATIPANFPANLGTLQHLSRVRTLSFWRAPSPLRFESHQNVLSKRQAGLGLFLAGGPDLRSASSPTRTSFPTGKPDWDSFLLAGPISAPLRVPPERPFQPASRIGTLSCWRAPSPLRFESHQNVLSNRQAGLGTMEFGQQLRGQRTPCPVS